MSTSRTCSSISRVTWAPFKAQAPARDPLEMPMLGAQQERPLRVERFRPALHRSLPGLDSHILAERVAMGLPIVGYRFKITRDAAVKSVELVERLDCQIRPGDHPPSLNPK